MRHKIVGGLLLSGLACALFNKQCQKASKMKKKHKKDKMVDMTSADSFPASDPPSWNSGHAVGAPTH